MLLRFLMISYSWNIVSCSMITVYLCYYCWNVYYHCAFVLWCLLVLMLSVLCEGIFVLRIYVAVTSPPLRVGELHRLTGWRLPMARKIAIGNSSRSLGWLSSNKELCNSVGRLRSTKRESCKDLRSIDIHILVCTQAYVFSADRAIDLQSKFNNSAGGRTAQLNFENILKFKIILINLLNILC